LHKRERSGTINKQEAAVAKDKVKRIMTEATRSAYLILYSLSLLDGKTNEDIASEVEAGIRALNGGGDRPPQRNRIRMGARKVARTRPMLVRSALHQLVVRLDLALHASLNACASRSEDKPIERQLKEAKFQDLPVWAIRDGVQLSVVRNLIVHAEAEFPDSNTRAVGKIKKMLKIVDPDKTRHFKWLEKPIRTWQEKVEWCKEDVRAMLSEPTIDDYLRLKKAVRRITKHAVAALPD